MMKSLVSLGLLVAFTSTAFAFETFDFKESFVGNLEEREALFLEAFVPDAIMRDDVTSLKTSSDLEKCAKAKDGSSNNASYCYRVSATLQSISQGAQDRARLKESKWMAAFGAVHKRFENLTAAATIEQVKAANEIVESLTTRYNTTLSGYATQTARIQREVISFCDQSHWGKTNKCIVEALANYYSSTNISAMAEMDRTMKAACINARNEASQIP